LKLPREVSGQRLAALLARYGYRITRQTGSHLRLTSTLRGSEHHITVPAHREIAIGTLSAILTNIAAYLEIDRAQLARELFGG
jgi:predicted RNA binding protein YcfA (HicA-like mRNA interferase family)